MWCGFISIENLQTCKSVLPGLTFMAIIFVKGLKANLRNRRDNKKRKSNQMDSETKQLKNRFFKKDEARTVASDPTSISHSMSDGNPK